MRNSKTQRQVGAMVCARVGKRIKRIDSALRFCLHRAHEMARVSLACFCFRCGDILHNSCQSA
jgi:hypothetical protein